MNRLQKLLRRYELHSLWKWVLLASLIGGVAGLGAIAFDWLGQVVIRYSLTEFAGYKPFHATGEASRFEYQPDSFSPWMIVAVMGEPEAARVSLRRAKAAGAASERPPR